jgi:hypothetical protein
MSELYMSNERYLAALKRIRDIIASGVDVKAENSNAMGDKYSSCTWGLCDDGKSHWPDAEDYLFSPGNRPWVATKYFKNGQHCPMDSAPPEDGHVEGCFWRCLVFNRGMKTPDRSEALQLFDAAIERAEKNIK